MLEDNTHISFRKYNFRLTLESYTPFQKNKALRSLPHGTTHAKKQLHQSDCILLPTTKPVTGEGV